MSLHHERQRAQHGHPLHRDHTEDLETGIASAVREIDEMRAALDRVRALSGQLDRESANGGSVYAEIRRQHAARIRAALDGGQ